MTRLPVSRLFESLFRDQVSRDGADESFLVGWFVVGALDLRSSIPIFSPMAVHMTSAGRFKTGASAYHAFLFPVQPFFVF